ncbi:DUF4974 domain-containing protein [Flavobacteriaceae bacterium F08102]|nr:DUF4974 domain-containing protein [Flavobacteriaceae bacterium F08102]
MDVTKIEKIIVKFLNKEADIEELNELETWLENEENTSLFNRFVKVELLNSISMVEHDLDRAKEKINLRLKQLKRKNRIIQLKRMSIAASILIVVSFSLYKFIDFEDNKIEISESAKEIEIGSSKAILTLEDGSRIKLEEGREYQNNRAMSNGEELVYRNSNETESEEEIAYNYITIPRGGEFSVTLADGTTIRLNSETKLKYPTKFIKGQTRSVELMYGEAYFEVSSSTKHNGDTFDVYSRNQRVNVLGTEFNIKAYSDEEKVYTTLVDGKIAIETKNHKRIMNPNQQAIVNVSTNSIEINAIDVYNEVSWKEGVFSFENKQLAEVMKVLSRWYDVNVAFTNEAKKKIEFNGVFNKSQQIDEILSMITGNIDETSYSINKKDITIN